MKVTEKSSPQTKNRYVIIVYQDQVHIVWGAQRKIVEYLYFNLKRAALLRRKTTTIVVSGNSCTNWLREIFKWRQKFKTDHGRANIEQLSQVFDTCERPIFGIGFSCEEAQFCSEKGLCDKSLLILVNKLPLGPLGLHN